MTTYTCQKCGKPACVQAGAVVRLCTCSAPIIAHLTATATGSSKLN
jgi:hypothetical protein